MLNVVIIDDEPVIVRSLQTMIERADCGFSVIGAANNAITGMELICNEKPDLVFADISMPVMNGLELIEQLRQEGNQVPVVILSGYKEFEYAKRAVALDVLEYLVKPINPVEFKNFLEKTGEKIRAAKHEQVRRYLRRALFGNKRELVVPELILDIHLDCWKICFGIFSYYRKIGTDDRAEQLQNRFLNIFKEICAEKRIWYFETGYPNEFIILSDSAQGDEVILKLLEECTKQGPDVTVTAALGGKSCSADSLQSARKHSSVVLQSGALFAKSSCIFEVKEEKKYEDIDIQTICNLLQDKKESKAELLLDQFLEKCEKMSCTQKQLSWALKQILRSSRQESLQTEADYHVNLLMENSHTYDELKSNLKKLLIEQGSSNEFQLNEKSSRVIIETVAVYLKEHAGERISLQTVAEDFGFNYTYLSYLFKKNLGKSPNEYLIQCRIEHAKSLLYLTDEMSVKEIAIEVGYDDPYYFSRIFKTNTGYSPSEYRKQYGK